MATSIAILDGNCYLHSGDSQWSKNYQFMGFPTGGIYQLMSKICNLQTKRIPYFVVFDSPSFRKNVNTGYKKSRKVDYKILAQANAIIPMLKYAGVNCLQVPEFEGDDLIANIVDANRNYEFVIYTCDYDLAINVSKNVSICGCKLGFPSINQNNFNSIISRANNMDIPYNALGIHKVIYGCNSDQIIGVGEECNMVWEIFRAVLKRDYEDRGKSLLVSRSYCAKFIEATRGMFKPNTVDKFIENIDLVFPRMLTEKEKSDNSINLTNLSGVVDTDLADVCRIFGLKKCYRMLTNDDSPESMELTEKERVWILRRAKDYKLRTDAVNSEIDINEEAKFNNACNDSQDVDNSSGFSLAANGLNIGSLHAGITISSRVRGLNPFLGAL